MTLDELSDHLKTLPLRGTLMGVRVQLAETAEALGKIAAMDNMDDCNRTIGVLVQAHTRVAESLEALDVAIGSLSPKRSSVLDFAEVVSSKGQETE